MTRGCDIWVNVPRPPLEASGTSGIKSAVNGGLQLSVLDGWWPEAYDGSNGWAIGGEVDHDHAAQDWRHAQRALRAAARAGAADASTRAATTACRPSGWRWSAPRCARSARASAPGGWSSTTCARSTRLRCRPRSDPASVGGDPPRCPDPSPAPIERRGRRSRPRRAPSRCPPSPCSWRSPSPRRSPAGAAPRGTNGVLAYEGRASATGVILWRRGADGSARRPGAPGEPADPAFSPLGRRIAFSSPQPDLGYLCRRHERPSGDLRSLLGARSVLVAAADAIAFAGGTRATATSTARGGRQGALAPDVGAPRRRGAGLGPLGRIAFVARRRPLRLAGGRRARRLSGGGGDDRDPAWSPDGRRSRSRAGERRVGRARARSAAARRGCASCGSCAPTGASPPARGSCRPPLLSRLVARRGLDRVRAGPQRPALALHRADDRRRAAPGRLGASDPRALDWQPRGRDPVIAAAGDIACDPD